MGIQEDITKYLREHPKKKAREIATEIRAERSEVNSVLYRFKGRLFQKSNDHRWTLIDQGAGPQRRAGGRQAPANAVLDTDLAKLSRYYLACIAKDVDRDLSEFASSRYDDLKYAEFSDLPFLAEQPDGVWAAPSVQRVLTRFRQERRQLALYVGFPTRLVHIRARSGWEGFRIEPLLAFEYRIESPGGSPELVDERPEINLKALRQLTGADGPEIFDESLQLQEELGLDVESVSPDDLEDILSALAEIRPDWPWREQIDAASLSTDPSLGSLSTEGIYNRAVLLTAERSPFTQGLEKELTELQRVPANRYATTAVGTWLSPDDAPTSGSADDAPLLEVLPLNTEQREAVKRSLTRPLTVITGPPGTGKSQVVTSILVNCAWRGQKVLMASKNNKAVDVVETRVNGIGPRPILLRLGSNQYQTRLAEYLAALLAATTEDHEQAAYTRIESEHQGKVSERGDLQRRLMELVDLRNQVDEEEQSVEQFRQKLGDAKFHNVARANAAQYQSDIENARAAVRDATRDRQGFFAQLFWSFLASGRVQLANEAVARLSKLAQQLELSAPPRISQSEDIGRQSQFLTALDQRIQAAKQIRKYFRDLKKLGELPAPEHVSRLSLEIDNELGSICHELWQLWLRLHPSRLSPTERRLLGDYKALLEMISKANEEGRRLGGDVFRRFYQIFPQLTSILPAWAVTNLSARGRLPMESGFFDLLVIDEASQCDIASVLPLLYRCRRAVIIGDPQQLRHITQIAPQLEQQFLVHHGILDVGARWSYTGNSLFDLAASLTESGDVITLRDHHRSHADIIGFSNDAFYEGQLRVATKYNRLRFPSGDGPAVRWTSVTGQVKRPSGGGAINQAEAKAVVTELERLLVEQRYEGTIGVVSPFRAQANRIRDLVQQNDRLMASIGQSELLVDTVYKFQGDERDVIIFSPVVSADTPRTALGFLSGNQNTFNVAVTRARAALIVVGDQGACTQSGVPHLAAFSRYVSNECRNGNSIPDAATVFGPKYPTVTHPERVSSWEKKFYEILYEQEFRPIPQYAVEQYHLDLALVAGDRRLDIEVDGEQYHRAWDGELALRDQIRNRRLIELGWDVMRFWVYQIRDETEQCVQRVRQWWADHGDVKQVQGARDAK